MKEADGRQELTGRVLSIYSVFERVTVDLDVFLFES
jgi:hypothetical protein